MKAANVELARSLLRNLQGWKSQKGIVETAKEVTVNVGGPDPFDDKVSVTLSISDDDFAQACKARALQSIDANIRDTETKLTGLGVEL